MITLRDFQAELIEECRNAIRRGFRRVLLQSETGSGKTVMAAAITNAAVNKGKRVLFVVHRLELVLQTMRTMTQCGIAAGIIATGFTPARHLNVQIAMVGTLASRTSLYQEPDIIIVDECHHSPAATWGKIFSAYPNAVIIGLSATPERLDGKGLAGQYDHLICGPQTSWLIENGFLSDWEAFCPPTVQQKSFKLRAGEFIQSDVLAAVDKPSVYGDAIAHYIRHSAGKRCIVFAASVGHSESLAAAYNEAGIPAAHVDGNTDYHVRQKAMARFAAGEIIVLLNCNLLYEGVDVPSVNTVQMLRPTASLSMYKQQVGRALRYIPGKTALILDHVGNIERHGTPDAERQWSLAGREKKKRHESSFDIKVCPKCYSLNSSSARVCHSCGHAFVVVVKAKFDQVDGDLVAVRREPVDQQIIKELTSKATNLRDWHHVARLSGKKAGWAWHQHQLQRERLSKQVDAGSVQKRLGIEAVSQ